MKRLLKFLVFVACTAGVAHAADSESTQSVLKASRHLADQSGYSWTSTSTSAEGTLTWRQGPTQGKTAKDEYTHVRFTLGDDTVELAFHADHAAIKLQDQWNATRDLQGDRAWIQERLRSYKIPAQESAFLARHARELQASPGHPGQFSGTLENKAVLEILSRGRNPVAQAPNMTGKVKFLIENGELKRYEYTVAGKMTRPGQDDEILMDRTTVVEIHKVRDTEVELPSEAISKLR